MMLGGGGRKGNKEGDGGKGHGSPLERHLEFEEGSLRGRMMRERRTGMRAIVVF